MGHDMTKGAISSLRDFPAVEILSGHPAFAPYMAALTRPLVVETVKTVVAAFKERFRTEKKAVTQDDLVGAVVAELKRLRLLNLEAVINGAGIIIHTNLGRAPISKTMMANALEMICGYCNLEFDLAGGSRGKRGILVERLLALLCETEGGTIVNNNAAALFIILNTLACRKEVIISRGELVQIGGGFRIPDIMRKAGVKLIEVGATNRTSLTDYAEAITERTRMILKVHRSNFMQVGFVEETSLADLARLCRERGVILAHDLGSGLISMPKGVDTTNEPDVMSSVRTGVDLTCFSGDKLLGGTQAGLIVGQEALLSRIRKNPLFRVIRCDKIVFAVSTQVFAAYLDGRQFDDVPVWRMITMSVSELKKRGEVIRRACQKKDVVLAATRAFLGGGSTPGQTIPSLALSIRSSVSPTTLAARFRAHTPPIIGRVEDNDFLLDLRTIPPEKDAVIISAIKDLVK